MNGELAARYAGDLEATLGFPGRMISASKSGYRKRYPDHVPVFNANVCVDCAKVWWGDLDLTLDEPALIELSRRIGEVVYVLYESDGRFAYETEPLLREAVYSVAPSGHTRFAYAYLERAKDGTLRRRPPEPDTRPRWSWRLLRHRPRLLRFREVEVQAWRERIGGRNLRGRLVYIGARDQGVTPLLVVGAYMGERLRVLGLEWTWYPARLPQRWAPKPLLRVAPTVKAGRLRLWAAVICWPGCMWELHAGYRLARRYW